MASAADAQSTGSTYRTALGVKVWDGAGISFKHFLTNKHALELIGYFWGPYRWLAPETMNASFAELLAWLAEGKIQPHVSRTYPLEQAREALEALRARRSTGKIVLTVDR